VVTGRLQVYRVSVLVVDFVVFISEVLSVVESLVVVYTVIEVVVIALVVVVVDDKEVVGSMLEVK
ncbi:MAG: hypothetical protein ACK56I_27825, partial [bacterium]